MATASKGSERLTWRSAGLRLRCYAAADLGSEKVGLESIRAGGGHRVEVLVRFVYDIYIYYIIYVRDLLNTFLDMLNR